MYEIQAGASAQDGLRSIVISQQLLGTHEIVLVKHTGCGMLTFTNDDAYGLVETNLGYVTSLAHSKNRWMQMSRYISMTKGYTDDSSNSRSDASAELKARHLEFLPFSELEHAVEKDIEFLKSTKLVPDSVTISGWVSEVETGRTRRVV